MRSFRGEGLPKNETLARETFERIHRQGRAFAAFCLAFMHEHGVGVGQDTGLAIRHYGLAADIFQEEAKKGLPPSVNNLGFMYAEGKGVEKDAVKAADHFHAAAAQGFSIAKANLGICYLHGWGVEKNEATAFKLFKEAADLGSGAGAACAGQMLRDGIGVERDLDLAFKYMRDAAEEGDAAAWLELGISYDLGLGIEVDREEAKNWYTLAAADGSAEAQARLAGILISPGHTEADYKKAKTLLESAADQKCDYAAYARGLLDLYGNLWHRPNRVAAQLTATRLSVHSPLGLRLLGKINNHSGNDGRDGRQAAEYFRRAAADGDPESQAEMGHRYEHGNGVPRDLVEAYAWHSLAASVRSTGAAIALERLKPQMSANELHRAEELAAERRVAPRLMRELQLDER
jgi:TPR repeat protein